MGKNYFTEEQQKALRENPYIKKVSEKAITYTTEFKKDFAEAYHRGKIPSQILADMGIDSRILGKRRKTAIVTRMRKCELRPERFEDTRKNNSGRPSVKNLSPEENIKRLELKVAYLQQENEFLKKNIQADRKATWEHKRKYPSDTNSSK